MSSQQLEQLHLFFMAALVRSPSPRSSQPKLSLLAPQQRQQGWGHCAPKSIRPCSCRGQHPSSTGEGQNPTPQKEVEGLPYSCQVSQHGPTSPAPPELCHTSPALSALSGVCTTAASCVLLTKTRR